MNTDTLLVTVPFFSASSPSLAIGLLAAIGRPEVRCRYRQHHQFASRRSSTGHRELLPDYRQVGTRNWLFAVATCGEDAPIQVTGFHTNVQGTRGPGRSQTGCNWSSSTRRGGEYLAGLEAAMWV